MSIVYLKYILVNLNYDYLCIVGEESAIEVPCLRKLLREKQMAKEKERPPRVMTQHLNIHFIEM